MIKSQFLKDAPIASLIRQERDGKQRVEKPHGTIESFRIIVREFETARKMVRHIQPLYKKAKKEFLLLNGSEDSDEYKEAKVHFLDLEMQYSQWVVKSARAKGRIDNMLEHYGGGLKDAHKKWIRERNEFLNFDLLFERLKLVRRRIKMFESHVPSVDVMGRHYASAHYLEQNSERAVPEGVNTEVNETLTLLEMDSFLFPDVQDGEAEFLREEIQEYLDTPDITHTDPSVVVLSESPLARRMAEEKEEKERMQRIAWKSKEEIALMSLPQLRDHEVYVHKACEELWEKPWVTNLYNDRLVNEFVEAVNRGDAVIETPSVQKILSQLREIERVHTRSTVGGVLVGEPGVGKTTVIRHHLKKMGRKDPASIDMSEEVTRYQLFGSPTVTHESQLEQFDRISRQVEGMNDNDVLKMVHDHAQRLEGAFEGFTNEERESVAVQQISDSISFLTNPETVGQTDENIQARAKLIRDRLHEVVRGQFRGEMSKKLMDLNKKNGWRDGVIIHALRNNIPLIIDEFNRMKSWTLIHSLMEAVPGEKWYFADNNEWITIPKDWRMYFTANIGAQHGVFGVKEAAASRMGGKVIECIVPPVDEELVVMRAMLCDSVRILTSLEEAYRILIMIKEVVPKIRTIVREAKKNVIPVSYRLFRDLSEVLIDKKEHRRRTISLDEAIMQVFISTYALYETREVPKMIVDTFLNAGYLLFPAVEADVMKWSGISKDELIKKREAYAGVKEEFSPERLNGMLQVSTSAMTTNLLTNHT